MLFSLFTDSLMCISAIFNIAASNQRLKIAAIREREIKVNLSSKQPKINSLRIQQLKIRDERLLRWMKIADAVSTLFIITMASIFTILNLTTPLSTVALLMCGFITDSVGLIKIYVEANSSSNCS